MLLTGLTALACCAADNPGEDALDRLRAGTFRWSVSAPLVAPAERPADPCVSVKDPSIVQYGDRWHLFCTIRSQKRSHQIEYLSFADWPDADRAERHVLTLNDGYFCAPQVFFFAPRGAWYLICQVSSPDRKPALQPAYSVSRNIADPASWSKPALLFAAQPDNVSMWIDFWVICDDARAHLFFTSLDGRMWRAETKLGDFPHGWSRPEVVLQGDIFEAGHTYRLKGMQRYLTLVEAQAGERRYYKAYLADRLDGAWMPLCDTLEQPFAGVANVRDTAEHWTDSFSHGELLRDGHDQELVVDPAHLRFLVQGVTDQAKAGLPYGRIPWRLGLLEPAGGR
ncbi:MAG: hypothetical protein HYU66_11465 [Armatimonadetes bacterium]|nr:hypothetical protein [Armatimonadota bacterium]